MYVTKFADRICVLHCFQKKNQQTNRTDIDLAASRSRELHKEFGR
jgi:phage-related protein